jgi:hypothetical protein
MNTTSSRTHRSQLQIQLSQLQKQLNKLHGKFNGFRNSVKNSFAPLDSLIFGNFSSSLALRKVPSATETRCQNIFRSCAE